MKYCVLIYSNIYIYISIPKDGQTQRRIAMTKVGWDWIGLDFKSGCPCDTGTKKSHIRITLLEHMAMTPDMQNIILFTPLKF